MESETIGERDQTIMRVMKSLARLRANGVILLRNDRGVAPLVVTMPGDRVGAVEDQVREMGGVANVILAFKDNFMLWSWDTTHSGDTDAVNIHEDSSMDMLRLWLAQCEGETTFSLVRASISRPRELAYQF